jgi:hypothetical protein
MPFKSKTCGLQNCVGNGTLFCAACRFISYCSKSCQKQDWKLRHKNECSHLREIAETSGGFDCFRIRGFLQFYQKNTIEYSDRWHETAEELTFLMDSLTIPSDTLDIGVLRIQILRIETYSDVLRHSLSVSPEVNIETLESYVSRAESAFTYAESLLPRFNRVLDEIADGSQWRKLTCCGRTLCTFLRAVCLQRRGLVADAIEKCKEAVASAALIPVATL